MEAQHTTGGITMAQLKKLEVHPLCQKYESVTGTKWAHETIHSTACGTLSCVVADKAAHFSTRWAELRTFRERQWLTALLCFPLYWLWVKVADVDLPPLPILINLQQGAGRILRAPENEKLLHRWTKMLYRVQSIIWNSIDSHMHIAHTVAQDKQSRGKPRERLFL